MSWRKIRWLKSQKSSALTSGSVNAPIIQARQCSSSTGEAMIISENPSAPVGRHLGQRGHVRVGHPVAVLDVGAAGRAGCRRRLPEPAVGQLDAVGLGGHGVVAHLGMRLGAEHVGVDEREVGHVEEVLDDARAAGVHDDRLVVVLAHAGLVPLREVVRRLGRRPAERDEDDAVALAHGEHLEVGVGWRRPAGHRRLAGRTARRRRTASRGSGTSACRRAPDRARARRHGAGTGHGPRGGCRRGCATARSACPAASARVARRCRCRVLLVTGSQLSRSTGSPIVGHHRARRSRRRSCRGRSPGSEFGPAAHGGGRRAPRRRPARRRRLGAHVDRDDAAVGDQATTLHPHVADVVAAGGEHEVGGDVEVGAVEHGHEVQPAQVDGHDVGVLARLPATR